MENNLIIQKICDRVKKDVRLLDFACNKQYEELIIQDFIFSHDFAKAFWGEEMLCVDGYENYDGVCFCDSYDYGEHKPKWQYHLQQMVLEKEPLKYLLRFLDEN
jgi:hypothetical protein